MRRSLRLISLLGVLWGMSTLIAAQTLTCTEFAHADDYAQRGRRALEERLFEDARDDYACAIRLSPNEARYYNGRGNAYYHLKQYSRAREDYNKVLELDPSAAYVYNNLANLYYVIGDYDKALDYYARAIAHVDEAVPYNVALRYTNRGNTYLELFELDKAEADFLEALEATPDYELAHIGLATLYSLQQQHEKAARSYYRWVQLIEKTRRTPPYVLGRSYEARVVTGDAYYVNVSLQAGDKFSASASETDTNQRVDPLLVLLDPEGNPVIADDDSGINVNAVINNYNVPRSGDYTLILTHGNGHFLLGVDGLVSFSMRVYRRGAVVLEPTPAAMPDGASISPTTSSAIDAGTFASYRLFPNALAEVNTTNRDRLNLRSSAGLTFDIIAKLEDGTLVRLIEGPRKEDGLQWWRVRTQDGIEGWAVERVDETQTLVMALLVGEDAIVVTEDERLNVRAAPTRSAARLFQLADGDRVTLLEAPQFADGYRWWKVRTRDGREGWVVDQIDGVRTIVPARERE